MQGPWPRRPLRRGGGTLFWYGLCSLGCGEQNKDLMLRNVPDGKTFIRFTRKSRLLKIITGEK